VVENNILHSTYISFRQDPGLLDSHVTREGPTTSSLCPSTTSNQLCKTEMVRLHPCECGHSISLFVQPHRFQARLSNLLWITQPFLLSSSSSRPFAHPAHNHSWSKIDLQRLKSCKKEVLSHQESNLLKLGAVHRIGDEGPAWASSVTLLVG
jgi:hypothetical protein